MKTSFYIKLFALIAILSLAAAKDTKASKSPKGTKAPKAGKVVTLEDFENPDKIITVEAEPLPPTLPPTPVPPPGSSGPPGPAPADMVKDEGSERRLCYGKKCSTPPGPKIASITEFGKKNFLAAIAEEKFPTVPKAAGLVCRCPPYAATFICIGFASCNGCCIRVSEIYNPRKQTI